MNGWIVVFLGLIALSSLVQAVFLIRLGIEGKKFAARIDAMQDRLEREVKPALEQVRRVAQNLGEISDTAVLQARRIDILLSDTIEKIEDTTTTVQRALLRPLGPLADIMAFLKGIRRGLDVYRQLRGLNSPARPTGRRGSEDDEHLFI
jgi:hypothetical protein